MHVKPWGIISVSILITITSWMKYDGIRYLDNLMVTRDYNTSFRQPKNCSKDVDTSSDAVRPRLPKAILIGIGKGGTGEIFVDLYDIESKYSSINERIDSKYKN